MKTDNDLVIHWLSIIYPRLLLGAHAYTHTYTHIHTHTHTHIYTQTHTHTHIHTYTHTYTHKHSHTHTHTPTHCYKIAGCTKKISSVRVVLCCSYVVDCTITHHCHSLYSPSTVQLRSSTWLLGCELKPVEVLLGYSKLAFWRMQNFGPMLGCS